MSVAAAASLLGPSEVAAIHQLQLDGLATALALGGFPLTVYRRDETTGEPVALPTVTVARRYANRQARSVGTEGASSTWVDGDFRAYAPWDVRKGDTFVLPDGAGEIVRSILTSDQIVTAQFVLDQGQP